MSAKAPVSAKVIVLVSDQEDANHWEITVLDSAEDSERLLETLLERGTDRDSIRVFTGAAISMQVTYKPVVAFAGERQDWTGTDEGGEAQGDLPLAQAVAVPLDLRAADIPAPNGTGAPVRFSSLFRPVGDPPAFCGAGDVEDPIEELTPA